MNATVVSGVTKAASSPPFPMTGGPLETSRSRQFVPRTSHWLMAIDALLVCLAGLAAYRFRFPNTMFTYIGNIQSDGSLGAGGVYFGFLTLYVALLVLVAHYEDLYEFHIPGSFFKEGFLVWWSVTIATLLLTAFIYLSGIKTISRQVVVLTAVFSAFALTVWRAFRDYWRNKQLGRGIGLQHVLIVGAGKVGQLLASYLEQNPCWGYQVKGFLDSNHVDDPRVLGDITEFEQVARREFIDEIFITIPSEREVVKRTVLEAYRLGICAKVISELYDGLGWQKPVESLGEFPVRVLHREPIPRLGLLLKRSTDVIASAIGLILLSPVFALVALAIKLDSSGPILYRAKRVGRKGRKFCCYKFRTMVKDADEMKDELRHLNERMGPFFKICDDPRITHMGKFLRKYSVDELPQLWNVLCGDMSLVGPRPHPPDDYAQYSLEHRRRLDVTPGLTCLWQVMAREDPSFEKVLALDSHYIENWSFLLDLHILLKTIPVVLKGTGQ
jgi:exopolysaccharide biosynthesis polyprenyl glycosylphosphotransferase